MIVMDGWMANERKSTSSRDGLDQRLTSGARPLKELGKTFVTAIAPRTSPARLVIICRLRLADGTCVASNENSWLARKNEKISGEAKRTLRRLLTPGTLLTSYCVFKKATLRANGPKRRVSLEPNEHSPTNVPNSAGISPRENAPNSAPSSVCITFY
jgi:hypothetical protein